MHTLLCLSDSAQSTYEKCKFLSMGYISAGVRTKPHRTKSHTDKTPQDKTPLDKTPLTTGQNPHFIHNARMDSTSFFLISIIITLITLEIEQSTHFYQI